MTIFDRLRAIFGRRAGNAASSTSAEADRPDMIQCHDALKAVHEFLDGELEGASEAEVRQHFDMCKRCYPHLKFESSFKDAIRRATREGRAPEALKAKVHALLAEAGAEE